MLEVVRGGGTGAVDVDGVGAEDWGIEVVEMDGRGRRDPRVVVGAAFRQG